MSERLLFVYAPFSGRIIGYFIIHGMFMGMCCAPVKLNPPSPHAFYEV